jgi:hypothetical protein
MMARLIALGALLALVGCDTVPREVDVPVAVGCLGAMPTRPVSRYGVGDWPGDKAAAQLALTDANAWEQYAAGLEAAQAGCSPRERTAPAPAKPP